MPFQEIKFLRLNVGVRNVEAKVHLFEKISPQRFRPINSFLKGRSFPLQEKKVSHFFIHSPLKTGFKFPSSAAAAAAAEKKPVTENRRHWSKISMGNSCKARMSREIRRVSQGET